jgi:hypothetical protein
MPRSCNQSRIQLAEYPLSPASFSGCWGQAVASSIRSTNCWVSCSCPGLRRTPSAVPAASQIKCNLVLNPPWLRPKAWSAGSWLGRFFFRGSRCGLVSPNHAAVNRKQFPVDLVPSHLACLKMTQNAVPQSRSAPFAKAIIDALPGPEPLRDIAPAAAIGQRPKDRVDHKPMVLPLATSLSVGRKERLDFLPLDIGKLVRRGRNHFAFLGEPPKLILPPSIKLPKNSPDRT